MILQPFFRYNAPNVIAVMANNRSNIMYSYKKFELGKYLMTICAVMLAVGLYACMGTGNTGGNPAPSAVTQELLAEITITTAVTQVIEKGENPTERAAKVFNIASEARSLVRGEAVTLPQIEAVVRSRLTNENLTPADLKLIDLLVRTIAIELSRKVGSEHLNADQILIVERVLDWVIAAASLTAPPHTSQ